MHFFVRNSLLVGSRSALFPRRRSNLNWTRQIHIDVFFFFCLLYCLCLFSHYDHWLLLILLHKSKYRFEFVQIHNIFWTTCTSRNTLLNNVCSHNVYFQKQKDLFSEMKGNYPFVLPPLACELPYCVSIVALYAPWFCPQSIF